MRIQHLIEPIEQSSVKKRDCNKTILPEWLTFRWSSYTDKFAQATSQDREQASFARDSICNKVTDKQILVSKQMDSDTIVYGGYTYRTELEEAEKRDYTRYQGRKYYELSNTVSMWDERECLEKNSAVFGIKNKDSSNELTFNIGKVNTTGCNANKKWNLFAVQGYVKNQSVYKCNNWQYDFAAKMECMNPTNDSNSAKNDNADNNSSNNEFRCNFESKVKIKHDHTQKFIFSDFKIKHKSVENEQDSAIKFGVGQDFKGESLDGFLQASVSHKSLPKIGYLTYSEGKCEFDGAISWHNADGRLKASLGNNTWFNFNNLNTSITFALSLFNAVNIFGSLSANKALSYQDGSVGPCNSKLSWGFSLDT